jgi:Metal-dependent amidase/aminoacylase/carboxypeptidase
MILSVCDSHKCTAVCTKKPELSFEEILTAEFVSQKLQEWGIEHQTGIAKTGIVATIDSGKPGPVLAIRADMDALPIQEENEVCYRSQHNGIMHACGHDGHIAIALGTACYLAKHKHSFSGTVKNYLPASGRRPWRREADD